MVWGGHGHLYTLLELHLPSGCEMFPFPLEDERKRWRKKVDKAGVGGYSREFEPRGNN